MPGVADEWAALSQLGLPCDHECLFLAVLGSCLWVSDTNDIEKAAPDLRRSAHYSFAIFPNNTVLGGETINHLSLISRQERFRSILGASQPRFEKLLFFVREWSQERAIALAASWCGCGVKWDSGKFWRRSRGPPNPWESQSVSGRVGLGACVFFRRSLNSQCRMGEHRLLRWFLRSRDESCHCKGGRGGRVSRPTGGN